MNSKAFIKAGGHRLCYQYINAGSLSNDNPILVFLHEGLGCIDKWKEFPDKLSTSLNLPALVYERYGYGNSDPLTESRSSDFLHNEAFSVFPELLENLGLVQPLILIGHSDGGSISLLYASKFPERVNAILLEAPHVMVEDVSVEGLKAAIFAYEHSVLRERLYNYHG
jgi:pimeloyl-ACP methyl ester carboxylesterase